MTFYKKYLAKELFDISKEAISKNNRSKAIECRNELFRRIESKLTNDKSPSYSQLIWFYRITCMVDSDISED